MTCTEMVSAMGLKYSPEKSGELRLVSPEEKPVAMQIFGSDPDSMARAASVFGAAFDIIDINMGCPTLKIVKGGAGAALMKTPALAAEIVRRVKDAAQKPVTVKIRKGWDGDSINAVEFAVLMQQSGADAVTVHGRTREQFYAGRADWDIIRQVKSALDIPVIANGDVASPEDYHEILYATGADAVMIGRACQGNPFIFREITRTGQAGAGTAELSGVILEHARGLAAVYGEKHAAMIMRKHLGWYTRGLQSASKLRMMASHASSMADIAAFCDNILHLPHA